MLNTTCGYSERQKNFYFLPTGGTTFTSDQLYFYVVSYLVTSIPFTCKQDHSVQKMTAALGFRHPNTAAPIIRLQDFIQKWPTLS